MRYDISVRFRGPLILALICAAILACTNGLNAAEAAKRQFDLPPDTAEKSLKAFSAQSGREVLYSSEVAAGVRTNAVRGEYTPETAAALMLAGTRLQLVADRNGVMRAIRTEGAENVAEKNVARAEPVTTGVRPRQNREVVPSEVDEEAIELSPFVVNSSKDVGYQANNTLAGSRLNTRLKDTAASISVLTEELLNDLGTREITEALEFGANNLQTEVHDLGGNAIVEFFDQHRYRVRGLPVTVARNYFKWLLPSDSYNIERIEDSRGPNSVLFGVGSPGGVINVSTKQANFLRRASELELGTGSWESWRVAVDHNQVLGDKLAVRLNLLSDHTSSFRRHGFSDSERGHLAVKYRPFRTTEVRLDWEVGRIEDNTPRAYPFLEAYTTWTSAGSPMVDSSQPAPAGTIVLGSSPRITQVMNNGSLLNWASTRQSSGTNNPILDTSIVDPSVNPNGPGANRRTHLKTITAVVQQQFGKQTFLEVGYNHQDYAFGAYDPNVEYLRADPMSTLPGGGANPYAGRLFIETNWIERDRSERSDTGRATLATERDFGRWGNYKLALYGDYEKRNYFKNDLYEMWIGSPYNATPENVANFVYRRGYVTEGDWNSYHAGGPQTFGLIENMLEPTTGRTLSSTMTQGTTSLEDDPTTHRAGLAGLQAAYFKNRVIFGAGFRRDEMDVYDRGFRRNATTSIWEVDYDNAMLRNYKGDTKTFGVVAHLTKNLSVHYNQATNTALPNPVIKVLASDGTNTAVGAPISEGQGRDMGFSLDLLDGKIYARAVAFETSATRQSDFRFGGRYTNPSSILFFVLGAVRALPNPPISQAEADAHSIPGENGATFDRDSTGYEFSLTANPTSNFRLTANYSYTDAVEDNIAPEIVSWWAREEAYLRSLPQGTLVARDNKPISAWLDTFKANMDADLSAEGDPNVFNRKHKVNFFARYDFSRGVLKGAYIGGGYRWQSKMMSYRDIATGYEDWVPAIDSASMLLGYNVPREVFKGGKLSFQLNISNLQDRGPYQVQRSSANLIVDRVMVIAPRSWRLTSTLRF